MVPKEKLGNLERKKREGLKHKAEQCKDLGGEFKCMEMRKEKQEGEHFGYLPWIQVDGLDMICSFCLGRGNFLFPYERHTHCCSVCAFSHQGCLQQRVGIEDFVRRNHEWHKQAGWLQTSAR